MHEHPLEEAAESGHGVIDPRIAIATAGAVMRRGRDGGSSHGAQI
jgi:hypothetical protein